MEKPSKKQLEGLFQEINDYLYERPCLDPALLDKVLTMENGLIKDRITFVMEQEGMRRVWVEQNEGMTEEMRENHRKGMLHYYAEKYDWLTAEKLTRDGVSLTM